MAVFTFASLSEAGRAIVRDSHARERRVRNAVPKAARQTRNFIVRETVPRAFGELADTVHVEDIRQGASNVVADAPHAAAVEIGSRPHMPPLEPLVHWVQLRGLQGLTAKGNVKRNRRANVFSGIIPDEVKDVRREAARSIAQQLRSRLGRAGAAQWHARASQGSLSQSETGADPATVAVARAIQMAIAKRGTKPYRYMAAGIPEALHAFDIFVNEALPDR